jgi:single-stranded-DNA-specific exonuclease
LLTTARGERAREIARQLDALNKERRATERSILDESCELAERAGMTGDDRRAIVLAGAGWHPGVVGIVCSRLVGRFGRPAILLCADGDTLKGSGRSIDVFNLHEGLVACADLLDSFGGHDMAAGLALHRDRYEEFVERFLTGANASIEVQDLTPTLRVDCEADVGELTPITARQLQALGPFGRDNPRPTLLLRGARVSRGAEAMGQNGRHLQVRVRGGQGGAEVRLVGWSWGERCDALRAGATIDAVITPKLNVFRGVERVEGEIADIRPH